MHIFNLNNRPHLILTPKEILFRHDPSDQDMQRHHLDEIETISIEQHDDAAKKALFFLEVKLTTQKEALQLPLSSLDTTPEELLSILYQELESKLKMPSPLPDQKDLTKSTSSRKKLWIAVMIILCIGLYPAHKMLIPSLETLGSNVLNSKYTPTLDLCSANAKAAFPSAKANMIDVRSFCGVLGLWSESSSKTIAKEYLDAEFSELEHSDYLQKAKDSLDNNKSTKAVDHISNALYLDPKSAQAYLLLSKVQTRLGLRNKALTSLLKAASLNPDSSSIAAAVTSWYLQEKNFKEAYVYARKAAILETNAANLITAAKIETALGMMAQAIKHYELSLQQDPENLDVLKELSVFYRKQHKLEKAAEKLQKIYTLDPDNAQNFLNYYEITLLTSLALNPVQEKTFVEKNKGSKEAMVIYDMLKIIRLCIENSDTQDALTRWTMNYENERLAWSFETLRSWLDNSQLDIEHMQHIQNTIGFFLGYQRVYNLNHNEGSL